MLSQSWSDRVCGCTLASGILPKLKGWRLQTDGGAVSPNAARSLCPPFHFCCVDLFIFGFYTIKSLLSWECGEGLDIIRLWWEGQHGTGPPRRAAGGLLERDARNGSGVPAARASTLNKRLAVVPGLDPVSSWDTYGARTGVSLRVMINSTLSYYRNIPSKNSCVTAPPLQSVI